MAFPAVESVTYTLSELSDNIDINFPASVSSGDLILLFINTVQVNEETADPLGFTKLLEDLDGTSGALWVYYKTAIGNEGGTTVNFSYGGVVDVCNAVLYHIASWNSVEIGSLSNTSGITPAPFMSLTPSWGSDDNLWVAFCGITDDAGIVSDFVEFATNGRNDGDNNGNNRSAYLSNSYLTSAVATLSPSSWSIDKLERCKTGLIAVQPTSGTVPTLSAATATSIGQTTATVGCTVTF